MSLIVAASNVFILYIFLVNQLNTSGAALASPVLGFVHFIAVPAFHASASGAILTVPAGYPTDSFYLGAAIMLLMLYRQEMAARLPVLPSHIFATVLIVAFSKSRYLFSPKA